MTDDNGDNGSRTLGDLQDHISIPCVWFFIPLSEPLGLPDGWMSEEPLTPVELLADSEPQSYLRSSLLIHQHESTQSYIADMIDLHALAASKVSRKKLTESAPVDLDDLAEAVGDSLDGLRRTRTVAEVAVPGTIAESEEELLKALNVAVEHVRFVQRVVAVATQRAVTLTSRATIPPLIPTFAGSLHETVEDDVNYRLPTIESSIQWIVPDSAPPLAFGILQQPFDDEMLQKVSTAADNLSRGGAFLTYADLRREAQSQRYLHGSDRMALVAVASAGEVLLDTTLLHMLWEEHVAPTVAAEYFDRHVGHTARVSRHFPSRLSGGWEPESKTPAGVYLRDVVRLRHRVVHAGHEPSDAEMERAWVALFELERYLGDRLAHQRNLNRYSRTALAWMGENGLRKRRRWTRRVRELMNDSREPNWIETFARWRTHVDRSLSDLTEPPGTATDQLMLYADLLESGDVRWVIHDPSTAHAAIVDPHDLRDSSAIEKTISWLRSIEVETLADRRVGSSLARRPPALAAWLPDHEIFPEMHLFPRTKSSPPSG